jgi:hypothetical protein
MAISFELGNIFSNSAPSDLNKDIPPIFKRGKTVIAITIIPIPPSHCNIDLQISTPLEAISMLSKIVEPVVVIPDMDSKNASVKDNLREENINGKLANKVMAIHEKEVIMNACLIFRLLCSV